MTTERKSDASSQPSFAERVARFEAWAQEDEYKLNRVVELVPDLLACIREQQAALDSALDRIEEGLESEGRMEADWSKDDRAFISETRAVLARWSLK
jgi:ribosome assembly protein YihI (activator of Der GTPase)